MSWTFVRRVLQLLIGVFCLGFSISMMIRAGLGISPWDVLNQGVSVRSGIPFGVVSNLIGLVVLLLWIPLRQRPGVGTVVNTLGVGPSAELGLMLLDPQTAVAGRALLFTGGLVLMAVATGLYIGARMGPGPRDGLMTGMHKRLGWPVWIVRTGIEVTVLLIGWALGGTVGIGTVAFALLIGPMVNRTLPLLYVPEPSGSASRNG